MLAQLNPVQVWSLRINPSDLYNIERPQGVNPPGGGGHTYIQIGQKMVPATLQFLNAGLPALGQPIQLLVRNASNAAAPAEAIEFWRKSDDPAGRPRMRIARQNQHRHQRFSGWSQAAGFPVLPAGQNTTHARALLQQIGGLRLFLARDAAGIVWGGFTVGAPSPAEALLPYAQTAWAPSDGGIWP